MERPTNETRAAAVSRIRVCAFGSSRSPASLADSGRGTPCGIQWGGNSFARRRNRRLTPGSGKWVTSGTPSVFDGGAPGANHGGTVSRARGTAKTLERGPASCVVDGTDPAVDFGRN